MQNAGQEQLNNPGGGNNGRHYLSPDIGGCLEKSPSLQRIHQQSSTETSGLGASEFSSRESIHSNQSFHDRKCDHSHIPLYKHAMVVPKEPKTLVSRTNPENKKDISPDTEIKTMLSNGPDFDNLFKQTTNSQSGNKSETRREHRRKRTHQNPNNHLNEPERDLTKYPQNRTEDIRTNKPTAKDTSGALQVEDVNYEWTRRKNSKSSIKSHSSRGSFRSRSGSNKFLGNGIDSAWMRWGKARRASFQRKLQIPDNVPTERATTPIKKARQELAAQFVHPDLTNKYISEADINYIKQHRMRQHQMYHAIEKSKKNQRLLPAHHDINISHAEWKILTSFWKHKIFRRSRYLALFFVILSLAILSVSVASKYWIIYNTSSDGEYTLLKHRFF